MKIIDEKKEIRIFVESVLVACKGDYCAVIEYDKNKSIFTATCSNGAECSMFCNSEMTSLRVALDLLFTLDKARKIRRRFED